MGEMMPDPIQTYIREIRKELSTGKAKEHSYRPALKKLIEAHGRKITAVNDGERIKCGAPDFQVLSANLPVGHVECKNIGAPLAEVEKTDQIKRYLEALPNFILTDYLRFKHYIGGEAVREVPLARLDSKGRVKLYSDAAPQLKSLLEVFLGRAGPSISTPVELARRMAKTAQLVRDTILKVLKHESKRGQLHSQMEEFRRILIHSLTEEQFADMYAQTIAYGLFNARCTIPEGEAAGFSRQHAAYDLPKTNPFLRTLFNRIAGVDLDDRVVWVVDDLVALLRRADMAAILEDFGTRTRREDPVIHFYETFLAEYDPKMREARGVYYTPEPVVSYIVESIDHILKTDFDLADGLADESEVTWDGVDPQTGDKKKRKGHKVQILDPATGTGTFLHRVIRKIQETFAGNKGLWSGYVGEHLLPRLFGFELLMAPYTVAHMKLGLLLEETGYDFSGDERLNVYLTNTLEEAEYRGETLFGRTIADEANKAVAVKRDRPVMVILGNPPYSGHSENKGPWIDGLMRGKDTISGGKTANYFEMDGKPLGERNPKWLNDDYVKFIRFAQWRIERTGYGILAFITNHGYLDNPTFRGMRQSLMEAFDDIYILDLHGNAKKRETCPDGSKDENVFDIQQGVAVGIFVKKPEAGQGARLLRADLYGLRKGKYGWLAENSVASTEWACVTPQADFHLFKDRDRELESEYSQYWVLTEIAPLNGVGMTTARDRMVIDMAPEPLIERARIFRDSDESNAELCRTLGISMKKGWDITRAREMLQQETDLDGFVKRVLYRPFDTRYMFYHDSIVWRTVKRVMRHMLAGENLGLSVGRAGQVIGSELWDIIYCTQCISEFNLFRRGGNTLFPLYLYPEPVQGEVQPTTTTLLPEVEGWPAGKDGRTPNLDRAFVRDFAEKLGLEFVSDGRGDLKRTFGPEDIFDYIYAVFHSPTYRERYAEFLKIDFPRVPLTSDRDLFRRLVALGGELVELHLLEKIPTPKVTFPETGDNVVEKVRYHDPGRDGGGWVYINKTQFFEGVPPEVWDFHIGGYQVAHKWLKDRKGRTLSYDDIQHYRKVITALGETIRIMSEIDEAIPKWPVE